jgi:predicted GNAT family N-acyltransferase
MRKKVQNLNKNTPEFSTKVYQFHLSVELTMELNIKKAEDSDEISKLIEVRRKVFIEEQNVPPELEIDECDREATHFIVKYNNKIIGTARLVISENKGKIGRLCILKEFRSQGIGLKLMNKIIEYSKEIGLICVYLEAQVHAIPFYGKIGFVAKGKEHMDAGIPHKTMFLMLKPKVQDL